MAYDLRPLSFSEILDRAFRLLLDNFVVLFAISGLVWIPAQIIFASSAVIGTGAATILAFGFLLVAHPVMQGALIAGVASEYLDRPISIGEAYGFTRPIALPLIGTYLLYSLIFAPIGGAIGGAIGLARAMSIGMRPAEVASLATVLLAMFAVGVYFQTSWSLIGSVMIVERRFGASALQRSRVLVVGAWWQTLGVLLTVTLIATIPTAALRLLWGFIPVIGPLLTGATRAVSGAYGAVALVIYYFDRRCRTEDFDLRLLAEQVRAETPTPMATATDSSAQA